MAAWSNLVGIVNFIGIQYIQVLLSLLNKATPTIDKGVIGAKTANATDIIDMWDMQTQDN